MDKNKLKSKLSIGAKIRIGEEYAKVFTGFIPGEIITLIEGHFEYDNGLYTEDQIAPSIKSKNSDDEFDSIYHLFENDLSGFMDCEVIK